MCQARVRRTKARGGRRQNSVDWLTSLIYFLNFGFFRVLGVPILAVTPFALSVGTAQAIISNTAESAFSQVNLANRHGRHNTATDELTLPPLNLAEGSGGEVSFSYGPWLYQGSYIGYKPFFGDFNGDGHTDILWHYNHNIANGSSATGGYRKVWLSNGDGTFDISSPWLYQGGYIGYYPYVGDFNGDGCSDLMWSYTSWSSSNGASATGGYRNVWLSKCDGTFIAGGWLYQGSYVGYSPFLGDFNGDGLTDILWHYNYNIANGGAATGGYRKVWLSNGDGTFNISSPWLYQGGYIYYFPYVGDFNGDGCSDLMWSYTSNQANGAAAPGGYPRHLAKQMRRHLRDRWLALSRFLRRLLAVPRGFQRRRIDRHPVALQLQHR